jgi:hypothetical protein
MNLHVYKAIRGLYEYIEASSLGVINPRESDVYDSLLDYPMSMYFVGTELDGETILYWEKAIGLFPLNVPNSVFNMRENSNNEQELNYNIQFRYSARSKSMDPYILYEINMLTNNLWGKNLTPAPGFGRGLVDPIMNTESNGLSMVSYPIVVKDNDPNSQTYNAYKLKWVIGNGLVSNSGGGTRNF